MYKWPRGSKMINIICSWPLGTIQGLFWTISEKKLIFLFLSTLTKKHIVFLWQKNYFCLKRYQMVQVGPNGQTNVILTNWDPIGPHPDIDKPAMFGHFWSQRSHFFPTCAHHGRMAPLGHSALVKKSIDQRIITLHSRVLTSGTNKGLVWSD